MDIHIEPSLTLILPSAIFRQKFHALQNGIAPIADTPEAIEIRDHSITAQLASLAPASVRIRADGARAGFPAGAVDAAGLGQVPWGDVRRRPAAISDHDAAGVEPTGL